jgi:excinuclease ABC subunit A
MSKYLGEAIGVFGARQNNLKNLTLSIPLGELTVVTGVSGSGKSSLVFDTLYAEGQRRYVETFSPYARQFLERMDKPQVDRIDGIPPAIAIDQTNPVRTSRSTVGTMTELTDHLKLLFARSANLFCKRCAQPVRRDSVDAIVEELARRAQAAADPRLIMTFPVPVPANFSRDEVKQLLERQGYTRLHSESKTLIEVVQDRFRFGAVERARVTDALEAALKIGQGRVNVYVMGDEEAGGATTSVWRFSTSLHCADCDLHYRDPIQSAFSFNSPIGACDACRGFGRIIGVGYGLVIPDESKTLRGGAVKPWQTKSFDECQRDMLKYAVRDGIPLDTPWSALADEHKNWVINGEPGWTGKWSKQWYGIKHFFVWLESKAYKMHIRVLLSRYRAYSECTTCAGARLKLESLLWRVGDRDGADRALAGATRFRPNGAEWTNEQRDALPGLTLHDMTLLPIDRLRAYIDRLALATIDEATELVLTEIRTRLRYLTEVGLGYLTLDRQSRTLSGGEVQRINLTTALGTSLVNTLFVLDEPSIGLHPRDMTRIIEVMKRLRDAGNSLLVVEHDPQVMFAANRLLDMGPGPGERGGNIVFFGTPDELPAADTLTTQYLLGKRRANADLGRLPIPPKHPRLTVLGAAEHNLKSIDVGIPLQRLVCVTGVSGSGKSSLVQDVLYRALLKMKGRPTEAAGAHRAIDGANNITEVVMVDQSPIGRTTRSNPSSYVGAFDTIRALFAKSPVAKERNYTTGTFSFNSGNGRCPTCSGNGFEHVEMQFLSDVYLRCPDCDGKRYRAETLEVTIEGKSIADVLEMTVTQAIEFFRDEPQVMVALQPLSDVGLDYLRLGQPVPTLSGGEAQRLKLAGHLAESAERIAKGNIRRGSTSAEQGALFLFDEPTTGLHFDDVAKLLRALRKLIGAGHSVIVIEHNLDVIGAADWLIDLGPEGGDAGGEIVFEGTPAEIMAHATSHTGRALVDYERAVSQGGHAWRVQTPMAVEDAANAGTSLQAALRQRARNSILVHNAREHNLKNIDVALPRGEFTVITGVSGSGKSTLAFDVVFGEGQRRYLESLNAYARQFVQPASRPDVDAIFGIPPTVAIEQRTSRGGRKSTVATLTEIYHFMRLLYVKLATQYCPDCDVAIEPQSVDVIVARIMREFRGQHIGFLAPLIVSRKGFYTDLAKWAGGKGFTHLRVDGEFVAVRPWPRLDRFKEHSIELPVADVQVRAEEEGALRDALIRALEYGKGVVQVIAPLDRLREGKGAEMAVTAYSIKRACPSCGKSFAELDPRMFSFNSKHGWCGGCFGTGLALSGFDEEQTGEEIWWNEWFEGDTAVCDTCHGHRLNPIALNVRFRNHSITSLTALPAAKLAKFFDGLSLDGREGEIARDLLAEIRSRLSFLGEVGLDYLALDRSAPTLSGGEAQRIRLAAQLGSNLRGVCYILDEPTIGLHPRDNEILLNTLDKLRANGNTLLVVEHDEDTIRRATHVVDLGPGAGTRGGFVVAEGTALELSRNPNSVTGRFLANPLRHPLVPRRPVHRSDPALVIRGATLNNLKNVDVRIPIGRLVCVTGVSGSGKSTLARDLLYTNLRRLVADPKKRPDSLLGCASIEGDELIGRVLEVDQTPIGKTPRSCPATYVGFWDHIRRVFAGTNEARMRGYEAGRFSFNTTGGRCSACEGQGLQRIEMSFLPDVKVTCDVCGGKRFDTETLAIQWREKSIGDVLMMSVDEAVEFFAAHSSIHHALRLLQDVGLGYLTLGQQSPTLSGGEAQRIKLVTELAKVRTGPEGAEADPRRTTMRSRAQSTLYVLDEPTVGLHMADVEKLIRVLHRLVGAGNTVVVIEHNLDVMADADWLIDLGPEGGDAGGRIVAEGAPEKVIAMKNASHTAKALADFLKDRTAVVEAAA